MRWIKTNVEQIDFTTLSRKVLCGSWIVAMIMKPGRYCKGWARSMARRREDAEIHIPFSKVRLISSWHKCDIHCCNILNYTIYVHIIIWCIWNWKINWKMIQFLSLTVSHSSCMDDWFELMRFAGFEQHGLGLVCKGGRSILQGTLSSFGWQVDY